MDSPAAAAPSAGGVGVVARAARRWATPSTPHFERALDSSNLTDTSTSTATAAEGDATAAMAAGRLGFLTPTQPADDSTTSASNDAVVDLAMELGSNVRPARRLSAFMQERLAAFSPHADPPTELDPEHRGDPHWSPPRQTVDEEELTHSHSKPRSYASAYSSPLLHAPPRSPHQSQQRGLLSPNTLSDLNASHPLAGVEQPSPDVEDEQHPSVSLTHGSAGLDSDRQTHKRRRASSGSARKSLDFSMAPVLHAGASHAFHGAGALIDEDGNEPSFAEQYSMQQADGADQSVVFDEMAPASRVSFGAMPSDSESGHMSLFSGQDDSFDQEAEGANPFDDEGSANGSASVVGSLMAALNRPSFMGAGEGGAMGMLEGVEEGEEDARRGSSQMASPMQASQPASARHTPHAGHHGAASGLASPAVLATPAAAPAVASTPAADSSPAFSPGEFFAARSAPLGSLSHSKPGIPRPTFNSPPYATGQFGGYMGAHSDSFMSPRGAGPVLYEPTPGRSTFTSPAANANDSAMAATPASAQRQPAFGSARDSRNGSVSAQRPSKIPTYSVVITPESQQPSRAFHGPSPSPSSSPAAPSAAASPLQAYASTPVAATAGASTTPGLFGGMGSPSPIQTSTQGAAAARAPITPHELRNLTQARSPAPSPAAAAPATATPSGAIRHSVGAAAPSPMRTPLARTSLTARYGPAVRTTTPLTTTAPAASDLFSESDPSLPPSPTAATGTDASAALPMDLSVYAPSASPARASSTPSRASSSPARSVTSATPRASSTRSVSSSVASSVASASSSILSSLAPLPAAQSQLQSRSRAGPSMLESWHEPVSTAPGIASTLTLNVQRSSSLQKLHRFAMFQVDPSVLMQHGAVDQPVDEGRLLAQVQQLAAAYVHRCFHEPAGSDFDSSASAPLLAFHSVKAHASRPHAFTLVLVFDVDSAEARTRLRSSEWMTSFVDAASHVCTRSRSTREPHTLPPPSLSFLELRPAHW